MCVCLKKKRKNIAFVREIFMIYMRVCVFMACYPYFSFLVGKSVSVRITRLYDYLFYLETSCLVNTSHLGNRN